MDRKTSEQIQAKLDAGETVVVGEPISEELRKAVTLNENEATQEKRTRVLRVTYKAEQAKLIAKFFKDNAIQFEFINTEF